MFAQLTGIVLAVASMAMDQTAIPRPTTAGQSDATTSRLRGAMIGAVRADEDSPDGFRTYNQMLNAGRCYTGIGRSSAMKALDNGLNSKAERFEIAQLQMKLVACQTSGVPNTLSLVRGSISEGLYHRLAKDAPKFGELAATDPQYEVYMRQSAEKMAPLEASEIPLTKSADCLAVRQPRLTHDVLATKHGSAQEEQSMAQLFAAAPECAGASKPADLGRSFLRAFLANSAYRVLRWHESSRGTG
jgi:hypothetical protein